MQQVSHTLNAIDAVSPPREVKRLVMAALRALGEQDGSIRFV
jgi:hypothetical protein